MLVAYRLCLLVLLALPAFALDPAQPVALMRDGHIVEVHAALPDQYNGAVHYTHADDRWTVDGWVQADNPSAYAREGLFYRLKTARELADESAAARAAADAAALEATLPTVFPNGVAVMDANEHHVELVPVDGDVIPVQISNSPLDATTRNALKAAAVAAYRAGKAAAAAKEKAAKDEVKAKEAGGKKLTTQEKVDILWIKLGMDAP